VKTLADPAVCSELTSRLASVERGTTRRWGTMSAQEMLCHVSDALEVALGDRPPSAMRPRGPQRMMKWLALWLPVPWPRNVATGGNVDPHRDGTRPTVFDADRDRAVRLLHRLASSAQPRAHPIFGAMSARDWLRWGYLHTDHHLRQFGC
jgi:hypothetical protein